MQHNIIAQINTINIIFSKVVVLTLKEDQVFFSWLDKSILVRISTIARMAPFLCRVAIKGNTNSTSSTHRRCAS